MIDKTNPKYTELIKYSNPDEAKRKAYKYLDKYAQLYISTRIDKKYMIYNPYTDKMVHFGQMEYEDFTKHKDRIRRNNYLQRALNIKGNWKEEDLKIISLLKFK